MRKVIHKFMVLTTAIALSTSAWAGPTDDMKSLIEQGRFQEAFNLGVKHEKLTGEPVYDSYFGIAAIDTGTSTWLLCDW